MSINIKPEDVHLHCRCCLNKFVDDRNINTNEMPRPLFQLFRYCTGFRIWQKGLYPEFMCTPCHELLKSFERFEKLCKRSSCVLEELLNGHRIMHAVEAKPLTSLPSEEITPAPLKASPSPLSNKEALVPIRKLEDPSKDSAKNDFSFENINVKPESLNENLLDDHHINSDLEDSLDVAELDDADVKAEISSVEEFYTETISKGQKKSPWRCTKSEKVSEVKTFHKHKHSQNAIKRSTRLARRVNDLEKSAQKTGLSTSDNNIKIPEVTADITEAPDISNAAKPPNNMVFENVVVKCKPDDSVSEALQYSDSDYEDSLALTELRKSTLKCKARKTVKSEKRKRTSLPVNSEHENFGPLKIEKPKVVCDKCPRKFKWPFELRRHIKEMHGDKPLELPCKYDCGKIFNSQNTLKSHYRIKHQMKKQIYRENAYICEQCGKGFKRLPLLERHRFHHLPPEARPHKCEQCGKTFVMERIYKEHLLRHSGNKKYECSYCGIKKATLGEYREHINIHTKEKEYACELCPKIFYRSKNLVQHVSAVHQGIKKHFCRFCQHSFANHINLVHHERIHTGEKPYSCEICKRSFIQPSALKTHMKTHDETRIKAKVGRKPKNNKAKEEFDFEAIMDDNLEQQINHFNE